MCSNDTLDRSAKARGLIKHFRREIEESVAIRSSFLAVADVSAGCAIGQSRLHSLICKALLQRHLMLFMTLHDKEGRDRACLPKLFSLLCIPEVRQSVTRDDGETMIQEATDLWEKLKDDPRKTSLRKIRDAVSAHNLLDQRSKLDQIAYDELWEVSRNTEKLVEKLAVGSGIAFVSLDAAEKVWRNHANEYLRQLPW